MGHLNAPSALSLSGFNKVSKALGDDGFYNLASRLKEQSAAGLSQIFAAQQAAPVALVEGVQQLAAPKAKKAKAPKKNAMALNRSQNPETSKYNILFDENISSTVIKNSAASFVRLEHVCLSNMRSAPDDEIWEYAKKSKMNAVITNDSDFLRYSLSEALKSAKRSNNGTAQNYTKFPLVVIISRTTMEGYSAHLKQYKELLPNILQYSTDPRRDYHIMYAHDGKLTPIKVSKESYDLLLENPDFLKIQSKKAFKKIHDCARDNSKEFTLDISGAVANWAATNKRSTRKQMGNAPMLTI
jgi:hypothetical protein